MRFARKVGRWPGAFGREGQEAVEGGGAGQRQAQARLLSRKILMCQTPASICPNPLSDTKKNSGVVPC